MEAFIPATFRGGGVEGGALLDCLSSDNRHEEKCQ